MSAAAAGRLTPVEREDAWYVCWNGDGYDWVARFEKDPSFDAKAWARTLAATYNARRRGQLRQSQ